MDWNTMLYIIASVILVSITSLIGILTFVIKTKNLDNILIYLVSFSVGALFGDVFIHLLPEAFNDSSSGTLVGLYVLCGILFSFAVEKFIHWRHCHTPEGKHHHHSFAYMSLVGDSVHNFIDGLIIAGAYFVSIPVGIATTVAVVLHEIPQELGDFGILIHGGFSKGKALLFNFLTALTAIVGAIIGILMSSTESLMLFLIPFAAGNLIYIAGSDLIPQLHDSSSCEDEGHRLIRNSASQVVIIILGILVMMTLLLLE
ncbi:MAG: ZIP family metal transporter [Candidatus Woesearchaeota archaeon]